MPGDATFVPYLPRLLLGWQAEAPELGVRPLAGTMLFADISGFTKMSERLAKAGKVGAEEVTDVLNSTFARLLAVAYENGGSLLKFGGDAILLFFRGREHAPRACHAAVGMRRKMREIGRIATSAGAVTLRMSIGVHSGIFTFFLAGESHRELIIAGPSASTTVEMEHAASAGEILVSEQTAASIDESLLGEPRAGGYLLKRAPAAPALPADDSTPEIATLDLASFIPASIREYLRAGSAEGEHRRVVVAFIRFSTTDELLARRHPNEVQAMLDEVVVAAQKAVAEHGICFLGSDIDSGGGKIILLAGAPHAFDNDDERMLRAVRQIGDSGCAIPLQIGVNRGYAFTGDVGPSYRRTYTVIGDVVNLAARVMAKAAPQEILVTEDVLSRSRTEFEAHALEPFTVKGKSQPVLAYRLGAVRGVRRDDATDVLPLIGRELEIGMLRDALRSAAAGSGRIVEIVGEPGIGKTRIVQELCEMARDERVIAAGSEQYETGTPYFTFRRLVRAIAGIPADAEPERAGEMLAAFVREHTPALSPWLPFLAIPAGAVVPATPESDAIADAFRVARMRRTVVDFVAGALPDPAVLVFEDAHWMDDASAGLLTALLGAEIERRPWLVCIARRDHENGFAPDPEIARVLIPLEALTTEAAVTLASKAGRDVLLPAQIATIADRSGGHPLFLRELVSAAADSGQAELLPESVEAVITERIDRLGTRERTLLRQASVLGAHFTLDVLEGITGDTVAADPIVWQRLGEFVEPAGSGAYRFRQSLYRDVAYEELPFRRRRELHRAAGEMIETRYRGRLGEAAELLSLHFYLAQAHEKSLWFSRFAGEQAKEKFANQQAIAFFRRALDSSRHVRNVDAHELSRVWEALGDVSEIAGEYGAAAEAYRSARRLAARHRLPELMLKEGMIRERLGQYSQALRWFSRGRSECDALADSQTMHIMQARLDLAVATARHRQGRYHACIQASRRAADVAERAGATAELARAMYLIGAAYGEMGSPEAAQYAERAGPLYAELDDWLGEAQAEEGLGILRYWEGKWEESLALYRHSGELRERAGHVVYAALSSVNAAEILSDQGHLDEAERLYTEARSTWRAARYALGVAVATNNLGRAAARMGRFEEAAALYAEALEDFRTIGAETPVLETEARLAELAMFRGEHDEALGRATAALERVSERPGMSALRAMLHRIQGIALLQAGDAVLAQDALDESLHFARLARAQFETALTLDAWAALARLSGRDTTAAKRQREASEIFAQLGVVATQAYPIPSSLC